MIRQFLTTAAVAVTLMLASCSASSTDPSPEPDLATPASSGDKVASYFLEYAPDSSSNPIPNPPDRNISDGYIAAVNVFVQGSRVTVVVCGSQNLLEIALDECRTLTLTVGIDSPADAWSVWTGERTGTTAIVSATNKFFWGTVTFDGPGPDAAAIGFTQATGCTAVDDTRGHHNPEASGRCEPD